MSDSEEKGSDLAAAADDKPRRRAPVRDEADTPEEIEAAAAKPKLKPDYIFLAWTSAVFLALDLGTKWWATKNLTNTDPMVIIPKLLKLELAHNRGGAWSLLADQPANIRLPFFFAVSAAAAIFIVSLYRKLEPHQTALKWALPLVLGGALGNLVDRVRFEHVVDFIDPYSYWPTFNVADIWIVTGVLLMAVDMFIPKPRPALAAARAKRAADKRAEAAEAEEPGT